MFVSAVIGAVAVLSLLAVVLGLLLIVAMTVADWIDRAR